ncbi:MAG: ABC transporter ATP-binding protein [Deltaproteobacteria bacterium]|nr:MAG: ABC transporter ATP-binding protein [Deltaproteobacteria bacterium]
MAIPLLEIKHLTHSYPDGNGGIFDISFSVSRGDFIILAGQNGSGKTTLIRHLNGLLRPSKGEIRLHGKNILKDLTLTRKKIGMVFQDADTQIVGDTVFDEVAFGPENLNLERSLINRKVIQILEQLGLIGLKHRNPATLSGGEKRKLAIAGILAMDPEIIIFDEPFANLDYPGTRSLLANICDLNQKGQTIIMATHDVETLLESASRLLIMSQGQLVEDGSIASLLGKLESRGIKEPCTCKITASPPPWQA